MSEIGWFPRKWFSPGSEFHSSTPHDTVWRVQEKFPQHTYGQKKHMRPEEQEPHTHRSGPSTAEETVLVQHDESNQVAFMRVYVQVPHGGTEFKDPADRRVQASVCRIYEVKALRKLVQPYASQYAWKA